MLIRLSYNLPVSLVISKFPSPVSWTMATASLERIHEISLTVRGPASLELDQLLNIARVTFEEFDHAIDLVVAGIGALGTDEGAGSRLKKKHIPFTQQLVRAHFVQYHSTVGSARDLEADASR